METEVKIEKKICIFVHLSTEVKNGQNFKKIYFFYFQAIIEAVWCSQIMTLKILSQLYAPVINYIVNVYYLYYLQFWQMQSSVFKEATFVVNLDE